MRRNKIYEIITVVFIFICIIVLSIVDNSNSVQLSMAIQILLILYLFRIIYGSIFYIRNQYNKQKYSYKIIMTLGLTIFLIVNVFRQIDLLIENFGLLNIIDIYNNTIESFSYFAMLILPCIFVLSIYSVITNIILIKKEGFRITNLLGVVFGIFTILITFLTQFIYNYTNTLNLTGNDLVIKRFIDASINISLSYFYCLILSTVYCNVLASRHNPKYDKDFVIILGSKIKDDGTLTPLLKGIVDRALEFAKNQKENTNKDIIYIPSGGKGSDEVISEGEAIKKYLLKQGIPEESIIVENKSVNTKENMLFSKNKINKINKDGKIAFSTTNYHVFRSGVIANKEGIEVEGMGSKTKWYFYTNALIREFFANLVNQKKEHIIMILIINILLFCLILIGHFYKLLFLS